MPLGSLSRMIDTAQPAEAPARRERPNAVSRARPHLRGRDNLLRIMEKYRGNMQAIADVYKVVKQTMTVLIVETYGLGEELERIRAENAKTTRDAVLKAIVASRTRREAAEKLGIPERYLYARIAKYGITREEESEARVAHEAEREAKRAARKKTIANSAARVARR